MENQTDSSEIKTVTSLCSICGKEITLEMPAHGSHSVADEILSKLTKTVVHDRCRLEKLHGQKEAEAMRLLDERMQKWELMCEPFYLTSEEWLKSGKAVAPVNVPRIEKVLTWQYGPKGLVIYGKTSGTGKTTAAWLVCHREFITGRAVVAYSHGQLSNEATKCAMEMTPERERWSKVMRTCDLLFIDDLGKSRFTTVTGVGRAAEEFLFELFNYRTTHLLPTVFTLNNDSKGLAASMSEERAEPFIRRLREFCVPVNFDVQKG